MAYIHDDDGAAYAVDRKTGEVLERFPLPWPLFRKELEARLSNEPAELLTKLKLPNYSMVTAAGVNPCFVSRMPRRKVQGPAHKETIKSPREQQNGILLSNNP
jgi:CRISPR-associated endonuclease Csn1